MEDEDVPQDTEQPAFDSEYQAYCEKESNEVYTTIVKGQEESDKQLLTLSSGLLAVLVAFLKDIVHLDSAIYKAMLYGGFAALGLTIVFVILSFQVSIFALEAVRKYWKHQYEGNLRYRFPDTASKWVKYTNWMGCACFIGGVILVFSFITINLAHQGGPGDFNDQEKPNLKKICTNGQVQGRDNSEETHPCPIGEHCIYKTTNQAEIGVSMSPSLKTRASNKPTPIIPTPTPPLTGAPPKPPVRSANCPAEQQP